MLEKLKTETKLLIMLAFFSISTGLWTNFKQLWLQDNGLIISEISNIISLGTFACVIGIILFSKYITLNKLKGFIVGLILTKIFVMLFLFFNNDTNNITIIKTLIVLDIIVERLIILSIYPFLTTIIKDDVMYTKRKLTEYLFKDIGILIGGILIGKFIFGFIIDYNSCLYISIFFLVLSFLFMVMIHNPVTRKPINSNIGFANYLLKNKILIVYCLYYFTGHLALSAGIGLKMLMLTEYFDFSDSIATNYLLVVGLAADILGFICLKKFTFKNDYLNVSIKFLIRFFAYTIAFISNNLLISFLALTWSLLISTAYENITDAPYINKVKNEFQLIYENFRYIFGIIGEAIGIFFCGIMFTLGLKYMFGLSAFLMIFQILLVYYLIYMRTHPKSSES